MYCTSIRYFSEVNCAKIMPMKAVGLYITLEAKSIHFTICQFTTFSGSAKHQVCHKNQ